MFGRLKFCYSEDEDDEDERRRWQAYKILWKLRTCAYNLSRCIMVSHMVEH
jgi:hypothetical protein